MSVPLSATLAAIALVAAAFDFRYRRIPNLVVATGLILGVIVNVALSGIQGAKAAAMGMGVAIAVYLPLYLLRAVGGGDLKLMAALGSIAGPSIWLLLFIVTSVLGGLAAIFFILATGRFSRTLSNVGVIFSEVLHFRRPYRARADLDVTSASAARLPHGMIIAAAVARYLAASGFRS